MIGGAPKGPSGPPRRSSRREQGEPERGGKLPKSRSDETNFIDALESPSGRVSQNPFLEQFGPTPECRTARTLVEFPPDCGGNSTNPGRTRPQGGGRVRG